MGRSKPRYPLQLDTPFVELCRQANAEPFTVETMLVGLFVLQMLEEDDQHREAVEKMVQKAYMRCGDIPAMQLKKYTQESLPF